MALFLCPENSLLNSIVLEFSMDTDRKVVFKDYAVDQQMLLPPSLDELLPSDHIARTINNFIDKMDTRDLVDAYPGGGASSYHPVMMLKVMVLGYAKQLYSCRRIADALRDQICFMWISGNNRPDFRTINRFRSGPLKRNIERTFASMTNSLIESGHVQLENYFLDGTKIESAANKYTWVWRRATEKYQKRLAGNMDDLFEYIDRLNEEEDEKYGDHDLPHVDPQGRPMSEILDDAVDKLNDELRKEREEREKKAIRKKLHQVETDYIPRADKYEKQLEILDERNSYSKTDTDATFMRMKEDHMRNGQLKPGYNVQMGTEKQFVLWYSIHRTPGDSLTLPKHMKQLKEHLGRYPKRIVADSGYGSEENYQWCDDNGIEKYIKFNYFHKEQKRSFRKQIHMRENWEYDSGNDTYCCPTGRTFELRETRMIPTGSGLQTLEKKYRGPGCGGCSLLSRCCRYGGKQRFLTVRPGLECHKQAVRKLLTSQEGLRLRSLRPIEVESAFGDMKKNMGFRRFRTRGLKMVSTEWGLLSMAHNMRKLKNR